MRLSSALTRTGLEGIQRRRLEPHPYTSLSVGAALVAFALSGLGAGCEAFDSERRPYTPFSVASGTPPPPPAPVAAASPAPTEAAKHEALDAPSGAHEWRVAERSLQAPDGLIFRLALVGDLATSAERDVLAWLVGTPDNPVVGQLWFYPEVGSPRLVVAAPGFLPTGPSCNHGARLSKTGPSSVTLDIKATCTGQLLPRAPERSVTVLAPLREQPVIVGFQLAAPAPDEKLDLQISSLDRDSDGRDDVELTLGLGALGSPDMRARFVWLDRPAGLSRDAAEPAASFAELAKLESVRASSHKSSLHVAEHVASARRLYASSCAESGVPRIFLDTGAGLDCGDLGAAFQAFTASTINAALNLGQVSNAFGALEQHAWFPSTGKLEADRFVKRQLTQLLERVTRRRVIKLVPLKARPRALDDGPHYSSLSFHADGSLLMLTAEGLVRAAPDGRYEYEASDEVDPWPTLVISPAGERLTGMTFPCDRSEVSWLRTAPDGSPLPPVRTALVAPRPGSCVPAPLFDPPKVRPMAWTANGINAFVGATSLGTPPAHPPMGSATSPNGRFSAVITDWGLLVSGKDRPALWIFDDPALPGQLHDCVISNNAEAAACILMGRAYVILPDPRSG